MKNLVIIIYALLNCIGIAASIAAYQEAANCPLNAYLGVQVDPMPYIAIFVICFTGLLAAIHNFNRNQ